MVVLTPFSKNVEIPVRSQKSLDKPNQKRYNKPVLGVSAESIQFGGILPMFETLKNLMVEELQLDPNEIKPESDLINDLGVNSIELADMIMLCEEKFGVQIEDDDIHKFVTVQDVADYLESHKK